MCSARNSERFGKDVWGIGGEMDLVPFMTGLLSLTCEVPGGARA